MSVVRGLRRGFYMGLANSWEKQLEAVRGRPLATPVYIARWEAKIADARAKAAIAGQKGEAHG